MSRHEVRALETEVQELRQRVEKLESLLAAAAKTSAAPAEGGTKTSEAVAKQEVSADIVLVISAAVAAFLGKRASIRQIRLTGESPWAMQGRATVQASHGMEFVRGRR
jgi:methylmalonyl-CoA carboxyltransferase large subunit